MDDIAFQLREATFRAAIRYVLARDAVEGGQMPNTRYQAGQFNAYSHALSMRTGGQVERIRVNFLDRAEKEINAGRAGDYI